MRKCDELKSRSLVFNEPHGNETIHQHMHPELISNVINQWKKKLCS